MAPKSKKLLAKRDAALGEVEALARRAESENRELTPEEISQRDALVARAGKYEERALDARVDEEIERRQKAAESRNDLGIGDQGANAPGGSIRIKSSERTYRKGGAFSYMN